MDSLSDTEWDVVISGTGLQPSLLALALSRSDKKILHVDANDYYGAAEAALSLPEATAWAEKHRDTDGDGVFRAASVRHEDLGFAPSRVHSIALAPQMIYARSDLLSQLVSSRAFRQLEFLAVGSCFVFSGETLSRIPSTREDVFSNTAIPARSKRSLIKLLRFVLEYSSEPQTQLWEPHAREPLAAFVAREFGLDRQLTEYVVALTLSLHADITVGAGLAAIHRHLTSIGVFGAGFAAVYPKWGGLSEIAQVGCRAAAVGGAVYMLGVAVQDVRKSATDDGARRLEVSLANGVTVTSRHLIRASERASPVRFWVSRLTAVVDSRHLPLFETVVEGAPTPSVAVVAFPGDAPIYAMVHSSDTGECPPGQCVIYLSTMSGSDSRDRLDAALSSLLAAVEPDAQPAKVLYRLSYDQAGEDGMLLGGDGEDDGIATFGLAPFGLAFDDAVLGPVREAWELIMSNGPAELNGDYMTFVDREGADADDDDHLN